MTVLTHDLIYEAIYDDAAFDALPDAVSRLCGARSAIFHFIASSGGHFSLAHNGPWADEAIAVYGTDFASKDLNLLACARPDNLNRLWNISENLITPQQFEDSEIHCDFYRPVGDDMRYAMGGCFDTPWGTGALGLHRGRGQKAFEFEDVERLKGFARDLRRMLVVRGNLLNNHIQLSAARDSLDRLSIAMIQVDAMGRVLHFNEAAEALCLADRGISLRLGYLCAEASQHHMLRQAIMRATHRSTPQASMLTLHNARGEALRVTLSPLPASGAARRALLVAERLTSDGSIRMQLLKFHGLSEAEASVAELVAEGFGPSDIAIIRRVSYGTVRSQLKAISSKMGCRRQSEIAAAVLRLPSVRI